MSNLTKNSPEVLLLVNDADEIDYVHYLELNYVEVNGNYIHIFTIDKRRYIEHCSLKKFFERIEAFHEFCYAANDRVVNVKQIAKELRKDKKLKMKNGELVTYTEMWQNCTRKYLFFI